MKQFQHGDNIDMKKTLKWILIIFLLLVVITSGLYIIFTNLEQKYQADADAKRVNDIHKISTLLEKHKQATNHYPFYDITPAPEEFIKAPTMVVIGTSEAESEIAKRPNVFGITVNEANSKQLRTALQNALQQKITLPVDPQKIPTGAPNAYYVFFLAQDQYVALTFLYEPNEYTTPLTTHVNVYALSSDPSIRFLEGIDLKLNYIGNFEKTYLEEIKTKGVLADNKFSNYTAISTQ
jgi:hypothetical protein